MKRYIFICAVISALSFTGCTYWGPCIDGVGPVISETRDISEFSAVKNEGSFDVRITEADEFSVEVEAQENLLPIIETFVSGYTLVIQKKLATCFRSNSAVIINITLPQLEELKLSGSGKITADIGDSQFFECTNSGSGQIRIDSVFAGELSMKNSGSGLIELQASYADEISLIQSGSGTLDAGTVYNSIDASMRHSSSGRILCSLINGDQVDASLSGSGRLKLEGDAYVADYTLSSSGKLDALNLMVTDVKATVTGSGRIFVYATEFLDATVTGSGDVIYRGDPALTTHISGSGSVKPY